MTEKKIFTSPKIIYEIETEKGSCSINVYFEGSNQNGNPSAYCRIENFTNEIQKAEEFVKSISAVCALPVHIPELAEEFLSI